MTQAALAARLFVTQPSVARWEHGISSPPRGMRPTIARALTVPEADLFPPEPALLAAARKVLAAMNIDSLQAAVRALAVEVRRIDENGLG